MDGGLLISGFPGSCSASMVSIQERIDIACSQACQAIAPSWPLDRSIAVNPYWQRVNHPLRRVAARMAVLGNISLFPSRGYLKQAGEAGRIMLSDLSYALKNIPAAQAASINEVECLQALQKPLHLPQLPLLIDVLDDDQYKHSRLSWRQAITHQVSQTCAAYFDTDQADWKPDCKQGLYAFWRETLTHDHGIGILMGLPNLGEHLHALPATARDAECWVLERLGLPESVWADYLEAVLLTVNGWASWCAYLGWQAHLQGKTDPHLRELLAIRLAWGAILLKCKDDATACNAFAALQEEWSHAAETLQRAEQMLIIDEVWQLALEAGYQRQLAGSLCKVEINKQNNLPEVQAAFCIDVRSERMRRALEQSHPNLQTIGFAGFFGLPVAYSPVGTGLKRPQLPGLLAPTMEVTEHVCHSGCEESTSHAMTKAVGEARKFHFNHSAQWESGTRWPSAAFSFVEAAGIGYLSKLMQWVSPSRGPRQNIDHAGIPKRYRDAVRPVLAISDIASKANVAAQVICALGLEKKIAPLVLLVGHGSQTANNAHAASLDCGACCGQTGEVNARALATLLNDDSTRLGLQEKGIFIPADTVFLAGLHNTTTDEIEVFDLDLLPDHALNLWEKLTPALVAAGNLVRRERAPSLGIDSSIGDQDLLTLMRKRANDGAQTRPEWGLAGSAAFIIAPRYRTKNKFLQGRVFLHDYDATQDADGSLLELLMTAPMLVTHWINWQYHSSTSDPLHMGCGNKVLHNVVGGHIGVFEGNGGDLRIGLSKQSIHDGEQWVHEPLRLTVVIDASESVIERIISKHEVVRQLVENGWLHLWRYAGDDLVQYSKGRWHFLELC
ncbi:MAG TPA: DUF2309 domain-containing protein [Methylophilus sp.]|nr:DUF2309 domain-containing protein [Methylophilus sp.]HQQ33212.1 DUF2309 domain-containing protein [Methylophilus sp.]